MLFSISTDLLVAVRSMHMGGWAGSTVYLYVMIYVRRGGYGVGFIRRIKTVMDSQK